MKLSKKVKFLLLAGTLLPVLYGLIVMVYYIAHFNEFFELVKSSNSQGSNPFFFVEAMIDFMGPVLIGSLFMFVLKLALLVAYIIHVVKDPRHEGGLKALWVLGLMFFFFPVALVYWFVYVLHDPEEKSPEETPRFQAYES